MFCSGIYKLICECRAQYLGKASRKFKQRYQEHRHSFIYNIPEKSKFSAHLLNSHHPLNQNCFNIVKIVNDKKRIDTWEQVEIFKPLQSAHTLNEQLPNFNYLKEQ